MLDDVVCVLLFKHESSANQNVFRDPLSLLRYDMRKIPVFESNLAHTVGSFFLVVVGAISERMRRGMTMMRERGDQGQHLVQEGFFTQGK